MASDEQSGATPVSQPETQAQSHPGSEPAFSPESGTDADEPEEAVVWFDSSEFFGEPPAGDAHPDDFMSNDQQGGPGAGTEREERS